ncbi:hypothetical protein B6S08_03855 [Oceanimonas doudoroffii]|uniref:Uncharacterized protein n=1 Tax=Oceanimonas doudoroffii TaxID=84158 RepID=A0A233RH01_9GAMM|nr:hypothetical protein B6S08_03855 [Oceanimonas doudoroffii]
MTTKVGRRWQFLIENTVTQFTSLIIIITYTQARLFISIIVIVIVIVIVMTVFSRVFEVQIAELVFGSVNSGACMHFNFAVIAMALCGIGKQRGNAAFVRQSRQR